MRNKIPCSADRLSLLDPPMIQGVVDRNAFHLGNQYLSENRVRIVEADEVQISSAVIGNSGLYEQTIRLKDGHLLSKCSCSLPEEPICRHCIAVLLEYHRWVVPRATARKAQTAPHSSTAAPNGPNGNGGATGSSAGGPTADLKLGEVMAFIEWLRPAMKALELGHPLPDSSQFAGDIAIWVQTISGLDKRCRENEEVRMTFESERKEREAYVARMTQQLQASMGEVKAAQANIQQLQQELTSYKEALSRVADIASDIGSYDSQVKTIAGELLSKGSQLEKLANSFRDVVGTLKTVAKAPPSSSS